MKKLLLSIALFIGLTGSVSAQQLMEKGQISVDKVLITLESQMHSTVNFDMSNFAKGVYQVRLTNCLEQTTRRIMKM
jgi:hypothetical protein